MDGCDGSRWCVIYDNSGACTVLQHVWILKVHAEAVCTEYAVGPMDKISKVANDVCQTTEHICEIGCCYVVSYGSFRNFERKYEANNHLPDQPELWGCKLLCHELERWWLFQPHLTTSILNHNLYTRYPYFFSCELPIIFVQQWTYTSARFGSLIIISWRTKNQLAIHYHLNNRNNGYCLGYWFDHSLPKAGQPALVAFAISSKQVNINNARTWYQDLLWINALRYQLGHSTWALQY